MLSKIYFSCQFLLFALFLCTAAFAQNNFEGKVTMKISGDDQTSNIDYFIKGDNIRMEMKADQGSVIILYNQKDSKTYMIMPEQKMYMDLQGFDNLTKGDLQSEDKSPNINRTGEFKDINGYNCEKWIIRDEDNVVEAWMTDKLGNFFMMTNPMNKNSQDNWQKELQGNFFPMKVDVMEDGEKKTSMEVLSINKTTLGSDLFIVPKGFQKFDMTNMGN